MADFWPGVDTVTGLVVIGVMGPRGTAFALLFARIRRAPMGLPLPELLLYGDKAPSSTGVWVRSSPSLIVRVFWSGEREVGDIAGFDKFALPDFFRLTAALTESSR